MEIGSVRTTAHRTQIRPFNEQDCSDRPNVMIPTSKASNLAETSNEPVSVGVDVACPGEQLGGKRKRRVEDSSPVTLRRSKRVRSNRSDPDFVYFN